MGVSIHVLIHSATGFSDRRDLRSHHGHFSARSPQILRRRLRAAQAPSYLHNRKRNNRVGRPMQYLVCLDTRPVRATCLSSSRLAASRDEVEKQKQHKQCQSRNTKNVSFSATSRREALRLLRLRVCRLTDSSAESTLALQGSVRAEGGLKRSAAAVGTASQTALPLH